jgi:TPR repeat protein
MCYLLGKGVEKNDQEALVWFKKAADRGDPIGRQFYELVKSHQKE